MLPNLNEEDNFLPTKDFFDFPLYEIPASPDFEGAAQANWLVITLPFERQSPTGEMLQKLLQAAGVAEGIAAVRLAVVEATEPLSLVDCLTTQTQRCLIFGRNAPSLGWAFDVPMYQPIRRGKHALIFADSLQILQNDGGKKKALWQAIQQIMG
jgi:hypothetical protein